MKTGKTQGVFVTGTDTGVGKTVVAAAIIAVLRAAGIDAVPMKPVQTGCRRRGGKDGHWVAPDLEFALAAAGIRPAADEREWMAPYCFRPAASPHLAAQLAGRRISVDRIAQSFERLQRRHEFVIVEGAGGILVPLGQRVLMRDLISRLGLPVILVARPGLGTINHTLLSLCELGRAGIPVAGIVFNATRYDRCGLVEKDNREIVERLGGRPVMASLPFVKGMTAHRLPSAEFQRRYVRCLPAASELLVILRTARVPGL